MELRKIASKKPLKLLTLLLTSMLIATASAAVYYSLYMQTGATISQAAVKFVQGGDWSNVAGTMGQNGTWCVLSIKAYPNATLTYDEPLNLSETSGSNKDFHLTYQASQSSLPNGWSAANWTFINFTIMDASGSPVSGGGFDFYTTGTNASTTWQTPTMGSDLTIPANTKWTIKIETKAAEGAWLNQVVTIVITVDVNE
jgi:hypothetical protein